jgi:sugar phosphate isomerase/epimerase
VITRRDFLATVGAFAGATALTGVAPVASPRGARGRLERIGIQLYSVRAEMQRDMAATLARLAQIGYRDVEFAGYFGRPPAQVKALLETNGLAAPSTHLGYDLLRAGWDQALDEAQAIGHGYVTIPWLPPEARRGPDHWHRVADEFNRAGERARARGLRLAYHNHDFEFQEVGGQTLMDALLARTDPALVSFQMDIYWLVRAGRDPLAYFRQHPGRFTLLHVKDSAGPPDHAMVDVGAGRIDFAAILALGTRPASGVKHVFVEHDRPADPWAFAKRSFDHLSTLEY